MDKLIEILKEVFSLLRSIVSAFVEIAGPGLRAAWSGACKGVALVSRYAGPTVRAIWSVLGPVLKKISIPFVWLGSRFWRFAGPTIKRSARWLFRILFIGIRIAWSKVLRIPLLSKREKNLMEEIIGDEAPAWLVRTRTKVDVGLWFRKRAVWICLVQKNLVLFAAGKTPVVDRIGVENLKKTRYNHITAELILSPAENVLIRSLRMPPLDAFELLSRIRDDGDVESWSISLDEHLDELDRAKDGGVVIRTLDDTKSFAPAK